MGVGVSVAFPVIGLGLDASPMKAGFAAGIAAAETFKGALEGSLSAIAGPKIGGQLFRLGKMAASAFSQEGGIKGQIAAWSAKAAAAWNEATYTGVGRAIGGYIRKAFVYAGQTTNLPQLAKSAFSMAGSLPGGLLSGAMKGLTTLALPITAMNQGAEFANKIVRLLGEPFRQLMELETVFTKMSAAGGIVGAAKALDQFRATAKATGLTVGELSAQIGPLMGAGFDFNSSVAQIQSFSRAAAVLGEGSLGTLVGAAAAFRGETFASGDALKQLAATGLPIYESLAGVLSQVYGRQITARQATDLLTAGFVTASQAAESLNAAANSDKIGKAFEARGATLAGLASQLQATANDALAQVGNAFAGAFDVKTLLSVARGFIDGLAQPIEVLGARWAAALDPNALKESFASARDAGLSFAQGFLETMVSVGEFSIGVINKLIDGINLLGETVTKVRNFLDAGEWARSFENAMLTINGKGLGDMLRGPRGEKATYQPFQQIDASGQFSSARNWIGNLFASVPGGKDREQMGPIGGQLDQATQAATRFGQSLTQSISNPIDELSKSFAQYEIVLWDLQRAGADAATVSRFQAQAMEGLAIKAGEAYGPLVQAQQELANVSKAAGSVLYGTQEYAKAVLNAMAPRSATQDKQTLIVEALQKQNRIAQETLRTNQDLLRITASMRGAPVAAIR